MPVEQLARRVADPLRVREVTRVLERDTERQPTALGAGACLREQLVTRRPRARRAPPPSGASHSRQR